MRGPTARERCFRSRSGVFRNYAKVQTANSIRTQNLGFDSIPANIKGSAWEWSIRGQSTPTTYAVRFRPSPSCYG